VTVYRRRRFAQLYTWADIELLASVDEAHETLSGPATRRILEREHELYTWPEYLHLATICVAHLYDLHHHQRYHEGRLNYVFTVVSMSRIHGVSRAACTLQRSRGCSQSRLSFALILASALRRASSLTIFLMPSICGLTPPPRSAVMRE
jgi:hypothetical protein